MATVFQRLLAEPRALDPQQYTTVGGRVSLCCPTCGSIDVFAGAVSADGRSDRAHRCLTVTCAFRDWLQFESWGAA